VAESSHEGMIQVMPTISAATPSQASDTHPAGRTLQQSHRAHTSETGVLLGTVSKDNLGTVSKDNETKTELGCCMHRQPHPAGPPNHTPVAMVGPACLPVHILQKGSTHGARLAMLICVERAAAQGCVCMSSDPALPN
jgi:hypothetical protein